MAQALTPKWVYPAGSGLSAGPVAGDLNAAAGREVVLVESGSGTVRCLDAHGQPLWEYAGPAGKTAALALWSDDAQNLRLAAVAGEDGVARCLDGTSGQERWRKEAEPGVQGLLWADLDGDNSPELVVTGRAAISVFRLTGSPWWRYDGAEHEHALTITGPAAACDIDGDQRVEIFAADAQGPFSLNGDGTLRWKTEPEPVLQGGITVAGPNGQGTPYVYGVHGPSVFSFDAEFGDMAAPQDRAAGQESGSIASSVALADLNNDGFPEVLVGYEDGQVRATDAQGAELWRFETQPAAKMNVLAADIDGDGGYEVLAAGSGGKLSVLDLWGQLKWERLFDKPFSGTVFLADVDNDAMLDVLFAGEDGQVHCLSTQSRSFASLTPWPAARHDAAQSGALPSADTMAGYAQDELAWETASLLVNSEFETAAGAEGAARPEGWHLEGAPGGVWGRDTEKKLGGSGALKMEPDQNPMTVESEPAPIQPGLRSVTAVAMASGAGAAKAVVRWRDEKGILREDPLRKMTPEDGDWVRFMLSETAPPVKARSVTLALTANPAAQAPTWWDEAVVSGNYQRVPRLRVLANQVGYEVMAPKKFTVASSFAPHEAKFELIDASDVSVFQGTLKTPKRIKGAYGNDWGELYWRGDFTPFDAPGRYRIRVSFDAVHADSPPFEIGVDMLWAKTIRTACGAFRAQRCGAEVPEFHGACHMDDAAEGRDLHGGWHDGGSYGKTSDAECMWLLADAFYAAYWRISMSPDLTAAMLEEQLWGSAYLSSCIREDGSAMGPVVSKNGYAGPPEKETDNVPDTGDERALAPASDADLATYAAALARFVNHAPDDRRAALIETAARALDWGVSHEVKNPLLFSAAMSLCQNTKEPKYEALAKELFPGAELGVSESIIDYETYFELNVPTDLVPALVQRVKEMIKQTDNPFGIYTGGAPEHPNFFNTPETGSEKQLGNSAAILEAARLATRAFRFNPTPEFQTFFYDQLNWILGGNPYGVCLMEGVGSVHAPSYFLPDNRPGSSAAPGLIANGITGAGPGDDRPWFDMSGVERPEELTNGLALRNTALYVSALCHLKRVRLTYKDEILPR